MSQATYARRACLGLVAVIVAVLGHGEAADIHEA